MPSRQEACGERKQKKTSELTSLWVRQSSSVLGAKLAALKTFYGWVARVASVCIHVHPGIVIRRKEVCCSSSLSHHAQLAGCTQRSHHAQLAGGARLELSSVCVRKAQYARGRGSPWCVSSFCLRVSGGVLGRGNHASAGSDILLWQRPGRSMPAPLRMRAKVRRSQEALGGRARPRGLHRSEVQ
jgi:hypothetical protein